MCKGFSNWPSHGLTGSLIGLIIRSPFNFKNMSISLLLRTLGRSFFVLVFALSLGGVALPAPTADAASCALSDTVYVNPAGGVDRGGCWGYDKSHAYATIQAAVDYKNSLYTGSETSFPTLRYKPSGEIGRASCRERV